MPKGIKGFIKGQKFSEEHKQRLIESRKGKHLSPTTEFKKGLIPWNKGKKGHTAWNKGTKGICKSNSGSFTSNRMKGHKHSLKTRIKIGKTKIGNKNHFWKGGITPLNKLIYHSYKYRQWRSDVFTRDSFICQLCNRRGNFIEAHHKIEFHIILKTYHIKTLDDALACEELWNINNGITLCQDCHNKTKNGNPQIGDTGNN